MASELIRNYNTTQFILAKNKQRHMTDFYLIDRTYYNDLMKTVKKNADELFVEVFATEYDAIQNSISLLNNTSSLGKRKISTLVILD